MVSGDQITGVVEKPEVPTSNLAIVGIYRFIDANPSSLEVKTRGYWNINAVDPEGALQLSQEALASPETALAGHDIVFRALDGYAKPSSTARVEEDGAYVAFADADRPAHADELDLLLPHPAPWPI